MSFAKPRISDRFLARISALNASFGNIPHITGIHKIKKQPYHNKKKAAYSYYKEVRSSFTDSFFLIKKGKMKGQKFNSIPITTKSLIWRKNSTVLIIIHNIFFSARFIFPPQCRLLIPLIIYRTYFSVYDFCKHKFRILWKISFQHPLCI